MKINFILALAFFIALTVSPLHSAYAVVQPDLIVQNIYMHDVYNEGRYIYMHVCNIGNGWTVGNATNTERLWKEPGSSPVYSWKNYVAPEGPGQCRTRAVKCASINLNCTQTLKLKGRVDVYNEIPELNEDNNSSTFIVTPPDVIRSTPTPFPH